MKQHLSFADVQALSGTGRVVRALSATWDLDYGGDIIRPGAFKRSLEYWRRSGRILPLLDTHSSHSVRNVIGRVVSAKETDKGLDTTFEIVPSPDGDEVLARIKGGYVDGFSIGYRTLRSSEPTPAERAAGAREVLEEILWRETSLVTFPMNDGARLLKDWSEGLLPDDPERIETEQQVQALLDRQRVEQLQAARDAIGKAVTEQARREREEIERDEVIRDLRLRALRAGFPWRN
jgi:HK97 family phage prohead protease